MRAEEEGSRASFIPQDLDLVLAHQAASFLLTPSDRSPEARWSRLMARGRAQGFPESRPNPVAAPPLFFPVQIPDSTDARILSRRRIAPCEEAGRSSQRRTVAGSRAPLPPDSTGRATSRANIPSSR